MERRKRRAGFWRSRSRGGEGDRGGKRGKRRMRSSPGVSRIARSPPPVSPPSPVISYSSAFLRFTSGALKVEEVSVKYINHEG